MINFSTNNSHSSNQFSATESSLPKLSKAHWELGVVATFWGESVTLAAQARLCRAFQMPVKLLAEASSKKYSTYVFIGNKLLLECNSNLANNCCVIEKRLIF